MYAWPRVCPSFAEGRCALRRCVSWAVGRTAADASSSRLAMSPTTIFAPASTPAADDCRPVDARDRRDRPSSSCASARCWPTPSSSSGSGRTTTAANRRRCTAAIRSRSPGPSIPILIVLVLFLASARVITSIQNAARPAGLDSGGRGRAPVLVGIPISGARRRHGERAAHPGERSRSTDPDVHHAALGRYGPQLLDSASRRQDRPDSESCQPDVVRSVRGRAVPRSVRTVLRNAAREDAASRVRRLARRLRSLGAAAA